jgi:hypothetical protein
MLTHVFMLLLSGQAAPAAHPLPVFVQYRPSQKRPMKLTAPSGGVLTQRGKCLGVVGNDGRFATLIWPARTRMVMGAQGLVIVDGQASGRVRLGDYLVFTGGALPRGVPYPLGDDLHSVAMPMDCAHYPGYDGWLGVVNPGFRAGQAPAAQPGHLPIARGDYVARPQQCPAATTLSRYNGQGIGWLSKRHEPALYPVEKVREEEGQWVASISAPGPGVHGAANRRMVDGLVTPRLAGSILVNAYGREEMTMCSPDDLPAWAREGPRG